MAVQVDWDHLAWLQTLGESSSRLTLHNVFTVTQQHCFLLRMTFTGSLLDTAGTRVTRVFRDSSLANALPESRFHDHEIVLCCRSLCPA